MTIEVDNDMIPYIFHVIHRKCTSAWEMQENKLSACNLTYVIQGEARYTINDETVDLVQGSLLALPKDCIRKGVTFPNRLMHCFSVDFNLENTQGKGVHPPFPLTSMPGRHEDIIHLFHELTFAWLNRQPGYIIKTRGLLLQIIHRFLELIVYKTDSNVGDSRIMKAVRYIAAHYSDHITARMLAEMLRLNPAYFGVLFKQAMGVSFNRYLIQTRVRNAENMLSSGEYTVGNVAEACGFTDPSHFYKQFKLVKGYPPSHSMLKKF